MRALVVGGEHTFVRDTFSPKLARMGIDTHWHWPWRIRTLGAQKVLPVGCQLVLVVRDMIGHNQRDNVVRLARNAGTRFCEVPRKFAKARCILQRQGFLMTTPSLSSENTDMNATPAGLQPPSADQKYEAVLAFLISENSEDRTPSRSQVRGHLKHLFGSKVGIGNAAVGKAREAASAALDKSQNDTDLHDLATSAITGRPENADDEVLEVLRDLYDGTLPAVDKVVLSVVADARATLVATWHTPYRNKTKEERQALVVIRNSWLRRYLTGLVEEGGAEAIPSYSAIYAAARNLFGSIIQDTTIAKIKREVLDAPPKPAKPPEPDTPWYVAKGFSHDGMVVSVRDGKALWDTLHMATQAKLIDWIQANMAATKAPVMPTRMVANCLSTMGTNQVMFCTVLRLAEPAVWGSAASRCYQAITGKKLGSNALKVVGVGLGIGDPPRASSGKPKAEPKAPDADGADNTGADNTGADNTEPDTGAIKPDVLVVTEPPPPAERVTRLHVDDRAVLVAELRAAVAEDADKRQGELLQATELLAGLVNTQAKLTRETMTQRFDQIATGLQSLSDALVLLNEQTGGRDVVRLDEGSRNLIEGLQAKVQEAIDIRKRPLPSLDEIVGGVVAKLDIATVPAPAAPSTELTMREVFESGRAFHIEAPTQADD